MNESDFCCIKQVTKSIPITIPLKYITKEIAAVSEILEGWKRQYVPKLQGVLVNYRNIRLSARTVAVHSSRTAPKCTITATFDMFCPTVGEIVKGTINRISREHIGCLIEETINVSIHRPKHSPPGLSQFIKINHPILFEIESFVYARQTIRVQGRITPECVELMKEVFPASQFNGFSGKDDSAQSDDLFSNTESAAEEAFSNLDNLVELTNNSELKVEETLNTALESPKKSKKRKHESESPTSAQKEKKPKLLKVAEEALSNLDNLVELTNNSELKVEETLNTALESPKIKSKKRKHESESPTVAQKEKKPKLSDEHISSSSSNIDSSDLEQKKKKSKKKVSKPKSKKKSKVSATGEVLKKDKKKSKKDKKKSKKDKKDKKKDKTKNKPVKIKSELD